MKVYNNFIDNSQEVETTHSTINGNMLKQIMIWSHE